MPRGGLKSSGGDWIVYSSALDFSFLLGNIASFISAWLFLWHKSKMTNGTQWFLAFKWHWEYQKDWSKTLLAAPLQTNSLSEIPVRNLPFPDFLLLLFLWCTYFLLTCFLQSSKTREILSAQHMPTGGLHLHRITNLQLMHCQYGKMMKQLLHWLESLELKNLDFCLPSLEAKLFIWGLFTWMHKLLMKWNVNDMNLRQITSLIKKK